MPGVILAELDAYLASDTYINWQTPSILQLAEKIRQESTDELDLIARTYHFVRDQIHHSWDVQDKRVTARATEVLQEGVGICWTKANLLAALLRANQIPAGICYQRLTLGDTPERGYCIHALNAVYISTIDKWIRLDARGNKEGVCAEMDLEQERLAFTVRPEMGEKDYSEVYPAPLPKTMEILKNSRDALYMYLHDLPEDI